MSPKNLGLLVKIAVCNELIEIQTFEVFSFLEKNTRKYTIFQNTRITRYTKKLIHDNSLILIDCLEF